MNVVNDDLYQRFIDAFDNKGNVSGKNQIVSILWKDTIELLQDISRDIYMTKLAYKEYNNNMSFMPNYYCENYLIHECMIFERIVLMFGIVCNQDISIIFKKKSIIPLYEIIQNDNRISRECKRRLEQLKSSSNKNIRNNNEHYISYHYDSSRHMKKYSINIHELFDAEQGFDIEKFNAENYKLSQVISEGLRDFVCKYSTKKQIYAAILEQLKDYIIESWYDCSNDYDIAQFVYLPKTETWGKNDYIIEKQISKLFILIKIECDKIQQMVDIINYRCVKLEQEDIYRYEFFIDSAYRTKECIRSLGLFFEFYKNHTNDECVGSLGKESEEALLKYCYNEVLEPYYYTDHVFCKIYSIIEKIAKYYLCKLDSKEYSKEKDFNNLYVSKVLDIIKTDGVLSYKKFKELIESDFYIEYEKMRNKEYHCMRGRVLTCETYKAEMPKVYLSYIMLKKIYNILANIILEEQIESDFEMEV